MLGRFERRYIMERSTQTISEWICENTTLRGKAFSFRNYEFQQEIVNDLHPNLTVIKCSQVGLSEVQIRKGLAFLKRNQGTNLIFTLPNDKMFKRISQTRVKPIVDGDKAFNMEDDADSIRSMALMQFGRSFLFCTGATEGDATSISADFLMHDELDITSQEMIGLFQSRLQNSNWKITQAFSTPTFTGFGVDRRYAQSDMREYVCRCVSCREVQIPLYTRDFIHIPGLSDDLEHLTDLDSKDVINLDLANAYVKCHRCGAALDLANPDLRWWEPAHPSRTLMRGYRVRPFSTDRLSPEYITRSLIQMREQGNLRAFYNTVLGEAYTGSDVRLSTEDILACMESPRIPNISPDTPVFVGIDIGLVCHLCLGTPNGLIFLFEAIPIEHLYERVEQILSTYRVIAGSVDRHPQSEVARTLYDLSDQRIMPVEYRGVAPLGLVKNEFGEITHVQCNRTQIIDETARRVRARNLKFGGYGDQEQTIVRHLRNMVREEETEKPATWIKLDSDDHYFHSISFLLFSIRLKVAIDELTNDEIRTMTGLLGADLGGLLGSNSNLGLAQKVYDPKKRLISRR